MKDEHGIAYVKIDADRHLIGCLCGWQSSDCTCEAEAAVEYDAHVEAASSNG